MKDNSNKKFWERIAKGYTFIQEKGNKELYGALCERIKPLLNENQYVLELACGTGQLTAFLADRVQYWVATDFSEKMIKEAKKRYNRETVLYEVQDATELSYENNMFDVILIANALHIMPEPEKALKEIKRVLKPDGILIAPTFVYEGKINKVRLNIMEKVGFKTFYQWTKDEYINFIESNEFYISSNQIIYEKPLPECIVIAKNKV